MDRLHYPGDHRRFNANRIVGPDIFGAWYRPVTAHYFDGVTTIFYRPVATADLKPHMVEMSAKVIRMEQDRRLLDPKYLREEARRWLPEAQAALSRKMNSSNSLQLSPISRRSGGRQKKAAPAATQLSRSQRELLKRLRKLH